MNSSNAGEIISNFYRWELENEMHDAFDTKITVRVNVSTASLFTAIANRFGKTRFDLVQTILDSAAKDMFSALNPEDRAAIAEIADKETTEVLTKQGITMNSSGWSGSYEGEDSTWRNFLTPEMLERLYPIAEQGPSE